MWIVKLKIFDEKDWISSRAKKFNVKVIGYALSRYKKNGKVFLYGTGLVIGKNKNKFLKDLKKDKQVIKLEIKDDFFIALITREYASEEDALANPEFLYPKPITILPDGKEIWEFASWDRKALEKAIAKPKSRYDTQLLSIKKSKIQKISLFNIHINLTDKQKTALQLAIEHGYYEYPKKTDMRKLAKIMKVSLSTYQAHLKKAEAKIISNSL
jgi:predicted DNA binding protein